MGLFLPNTEIRETSGRPVKITHSAQLEEFNPTSEQARKVMRAIRAGREVTIQPVLRIEITYPSKLQKKLGARQLYLGKQKSNVMRILYV